MDTPLNVVFLIAFATTCLTCHVTASLRSSRNDCSVTKKLQMVKPASNCVQRGIVIPICSGTCLTRDSVMAGDYDVTKGIQCACCHPIAFKTISVKFVCKVRSGQLMALRKKLKVPLKCSCNSNCGAIKATRKPSFKPLTTGSNIRKRRSSVF